LKKIVVTGGAGFIGSHFVVRSIATRADAEITVLDSLTYAGSMSKLSEVSSDIRFIEGDIRDPALVRNSIRGADLVVHFAAESHNDNSLNDPNVFFETNTFGTINVATACAEFDVRLHHVSTDEVFGDLPLGSSERFDVSSPYRPSSPYSASKAAADHVIRSWVRSFGLQATISNCSNNYGTRQHWEKLIPATIRRLGSGVNAKLYGTGLNVRDWIHVDDHVDGIWLAIEKGEIGSTYLFGSNDTRTNLEIVHAIAASMGRGTEEIEFVSDRAGHDRKYAINPESANSQLGWSAKHSSVIEYMPYLVESYLKVLP